MAGTDLKQLPVDRMLNIVEYLFEKNVLEEKEIHDAREKVRAQMRDAFRLPDGAPVVKNGDYADTTGGLQEGEIDEFGRTMPKRRAPNAKTKPPLPILRPSDDENNPFPGLEGPLN